MELTALRQFVEVCRQGHVTRAARTLGVTQSALSAMLRKLEGELGTTLMHRTIYVCLGLFGIVPGAVAAVVLTEGTLGRGYGVWSGIGVFFIFVLVLTLTPSLLIAWRRKRIRDGIMRAMALPSAPASVITKNDANIQPDRLESSPPSGDSLPASPPSPTQGTP